MVTWSARLTGSWRLRTQYWWTCTRGSTQSGPTPWSPRAAELKQTRDYGSQIVVIMCSYQINFTVIRYLVGGFDLVFRLCGGLVLPQLVGWKEKSGAFYLACPSVTFDKLWLGVLCVYVYWPISSDWALYMSVDHIKLGLGVLFVYVQYVVGS